MSSPAPTLPAVTTVLSLVLSGVIIHASDRLLTTSTGRSWDPQSNKTLVHWGKGHWFIAGYTGSAFNKENKPTDQWMAEVLTGQNLDDVGGLQVSTGVLHRMDAYHAIERIREAAKDSFPPTTHQRPLFLIQGLQSRRRRLRPISVIVGPDGDDYRSEWDPIPHYATVGSGLLRQVGQFHDDVRARTLSSLANADSIEAMREVLVGAIRETADRSPSVGRNIMTVVAPLSAEGATPTPLVLIRYERDPARFAKPTTFTDRGGITRTITVTAYTPWVIHPYGFVAPALDVGWGGWDSPGRLRIVVESSHPPASTRQRLFSSQRRKRP